MSRTKRKQIVLLYWLEESKRPQLVIREERKTTATFSVCLNAQIGPPTQTNVALAYLILIRCGYALLIKIKASSNYEYDLVCVLCVLLLLHLK